MADRDINQLLAKNLKARMNDAEVNQTELAKKSGVAQNTISLYLAPEKRKPGAKGKEPSGNLTQIDKMAAALDLQAWQLLLPEGAIEGEEVNGWPLPPELLAALQNADPKTLKRAQNALMSALDFEMAPVSGPASETAGAARVSAAIINFPTPNSRGEPRTRAVKSSSAACRVLHLNSVSRDRA